jgi:hypothetical protein
MGVVEAAACLCVSTNAIQAMLAIRAIGSTALHKAVLKGNDPILAAGARIKNAAVAIKALKQSSGLERELIRIATGATADPVTMLLNLEPDQLVAVTNALGTEWIWDKLISPVLSTEPDKTVVAEPKPMTVTVVKMDK